MTVSSRSCFYRLYRVSPSSATNNIISLIPVLTIRWCPCVELSLVLLEEGVCCDQCVLLAKLSQPLPCFILYSNATCPLLQVSLDFLLLHSNPLWWKEHLFLVLVLEGLVGHYSRYLLTSCFCIPIPYDEKNIFFLVLVLEGLVGHHKTIQLQLLWPWCLGPRLDLCDIEWFALEINRDHSVIFEFAPRYCILDSLVDYED